MENPKINKGNYKLVYINNVGTEWDGDNLYEFLFSNTPEDVDGYGWDIVPASGQAKPPVRDLIGLVGKVNTDITFKLVQDSDTFAYWDSVDGIVSIGWEDIDDYTTYPESRLFFKYGESVDSVVDKLYERDLSLKITELSN